MYYISFRLQIGRLNELNANDESHQKEIVDLMEKTQQYRKEEVFAADKIATWHLESFLSEFKHFMTKEGKYVNISYLLFYHLKSIF